ncbi:hypothetical protein ACJX0J_007959 [Zea mays]
MMMLSCYAIKENKHIIFYKRNYADLVIWTYLSHICASITSLLLQHKFTILRFMYMYCFPSNWFTANYVEVLQCLVLHLGTMQQIMNKKVTFFYSKIEPIYNNQIEKFKYFTET